MLLGRVLNNMSDIDQLILIFNCSAARCEDFKEVQTEIEVEPQNFQQLTEVQLLSIGPTIKRILKGNQ